MPTEPIAAPARAPEPRAQWMRRYAALRLKLAVAVTAVALAQYFGGAFVRAGGDVEPLRLQDPPGAVMVFTATGAPAATLVVARTTDTGDLRWRLDTGLDRFALQQILPGEAVTAFVGTRPRTPDRVPEPLLVLVAHANGTQVVHSLWR